MSSLLLSRPKARPTGGKAEPFFKGNPGYHRNCQCSLCLSEQRTQRLRPKYGRLRTHELGIAIRPCGADSQISHTDGEAMSGGAEKTESKGRTNKERGKLVFSMSKNPM
jgi:hypothetical protein